MDEAPPARRGGAAWPRREAWWTPAWAWWDDKALDVLGVGHHAAEGEAVAGTAGVDAVATRRRVPPLDGLERDAVDAARQLGFEAFVLKGGTPPRAIHGIF